jgi:hypothetical protein
MRRQAGRSASSGAEPAAVAALQAALAAEQAASYGYGVVGSHLTGAKFAQASADSVAHERARDSLTVMITDRGAQPRPAAVAYQLPIPVASPTQAIALATLLEHQVAGAYPALVAVPDPALRAFAARRMASCAVTAARWSGHSQAFPGLRG